MLHRLLTLLAGMALFACGPIGCQVAKTSFQMDSDSRTPGVGLQLAPKPKQKDDKSAVTSADHYGRDATVTHADATAEATPPAKSRWTKWLDRFRRPKRIPLPVTDTEPADATSLELDAPSDGLNSF